IGQMSVGRSGDVAGGPAIGVLNLDSEPPQAALDEVLAHPHIHSAIVVQLPKAGELPAWMAS
ncbi:MAG: phosphoglycerate dehydrogenase, partial [Planctomycetales bacterium]|nr:phosphoglycerate dehydrogenase [Planctomycetales bacterium]